MKNKELTYHGWTNWDTWNCNLWLTNEELTYRSAKKRISPYELKLFWEGFFDGMDGIDTEKVNFEEIFSMLHE